MICIGLLLSPVTALTFGVIFAVYVYVWNMTHPFLLGTMASLDRTGIEVVYGVAMQYLGTTAGPACERSLGHAADDSPRVPEAQERPIRRDLYATHPPAPYLVDRMRATKVRREAARSGADTDPHARRLQRFVRARPLACCT
jgi:hypothetical protein